MARIVRRERERAGVTQVELARRAGISSSTVSRFEAGRAMPSLRTYHTMLDTYSVISGKSRLELIELVVAEWRQTENSA